MARLLILFATLAVASVLPRSETFNIRRRQEEISYENPVCVAYCDEGSCSGGTCSIVNLKSRDQLLGRSFSASTGGQANETLSKRVFNYRPGKREYFRRPPTADEADSYLPAVFNNQDNTYYSDPLPLASEDGAADYHSAWAQQKEFGNSPFQIISGGLHGCTTVTIISNRGVWMAHFWEVYSNGPVDLISGFNLHDTIDDPVYKERVLDFIMGIPVTSPTWPEWRVGWDESAPSRPYWPPHGPSPDPDLFNRDQDETQVFIMTPVQFGERAGSTNYLYGARLVEMVEKINERLGIPPKVIVYGYERLNYRNPLHAPYIDVTRFGYALFQYDPDSDRRGNKAWRLFYEGKFARKSTTYKKD